MSCPAPLTARPSPGQSGQLGTDDAATFDGRDEAISFFNTFASDARRVSICFFRYDWVITPFLTASSLPSRPITTVPGKAGPSPKRFISSVVAPSQTGKLIPVSLIKVTTFCRSIICVGRGPYHLNTQGSVLILYRSQIRHFLATGNTPRGPEIQHHHFPTIRAKFLFNAEEILEG